MKQERFQEKRVIDSIAKMFLTVAMICGIIAVFAATNHIMEDAPAKYHKLSLGLMVCFWMAGQLLFIKTENVKILRQFMLVDAISAIIFGSLAVIGRGDLQATGHDEFALSFLMLCAGGVAPFVCTTIKARGEVFEWLKFEVVRKWVTEHKWMISAEIILLVLITFRGGATLRWDAQYIAEVQTGVQLSDVFNLSRMSFYGHIDMSYAAFTAIMTTFAGSAEKGEKLATLILILCSSAAMYGSLKSYVSERTDFEYAILSLCWGLSPFVLGMSGDYIYDLYAIWLVPIVVYFALSERWLLHLSSALFLVFSKEPAFVAYAGYAFGLLLTDMILKRRSIGYLLKSSRYWGMLLVGCTWLYVYAILPNCWGGEGITYFSLNIPYVLEKCKVLYVLNFNWILTVLAVIGIGEVLVKKRRFSQSIFPLLICDLFFVVFSCLFVTVNHARYIDTHIAVLNILAFLGIEVIRQARIRLVASSVITVLVFTSNYFTIDPFSRLVFQQYNVGTTTMIGTSSGEYMSDSMVYNRQWEFFDKALDMALEDIVEDGDQIFYPKINGWTWFFLGEGKDEVMMEQYYDVQKKKHVWSVNDNCVSYMLCNADSLEVIEENLGDNIGYYIYFPFIGAELADEIREEETVLKEENFTYLGVVATRIKFTN